MAHDLDFSLGKAAIAFAGETPWHRHGQKAEEGWTLDQWIDAAGIGYTVERIQAFAGDVAVNGAYFNRRSDTGAILGTQTHTERRCEVQPREIAHFVHGFVATDDRFQLQVMGAIRGGVQVWATASFNGDMTVAGEKHRAYLLARTGFDGSLATYLQMTVIRAVCNNTLSAAFADKRAMLTVRHSTRFDAKAAASRLAKLAQGVDAFKAVGDALAQNGMGKEEVNKFFRQLLGIPFDAKRKDVSTRKLNQFGDLSHAYGESVREGAADGSAWAALQAVTRYVDHDRTARGSENEPDESKRFVSSQFGSGADLKGQAWNLLMPRIKDRVLIPA
jgi:phage/plasmid-like protein (TIGR03299 family)